MDFQELFNSINEFNKIFIFGHKRPDGDCYGSLNGLKDIIKETFPTKSVFCLTEDNEFLSFLGKMDHIFDDDLFVDGLAIVCDCSNRERIADSRYKLCKKVIKVDHHLITDNFGDVNIVDEDISATCLLITKFFFKFKDKLKISRIGAQALYTGTITDTSNFRYRGVNEETLSLAGKLIKFGVDVEEIDRHLSTESLKATKLKSYVYKTLKITKYGFVYAKISKSIIKHLNVTYDEASSMVNLLANIEGCPIWGLFIQYPKEIRVRLRSNGPDINQIAEKFGGGGHQKACGTTIKSWHTAKSIIKEADLFLKSLK